MYAIMPTCRHADTLTYGQGQGRYPHSVFRREIGSGCNQLQRNGCGSFHNCYKQRRHAGTIFFIDVEVRTFQQLFDQGWSVLFDSVEQRGVPKLVLHVDVLGTIDAQFGDALAAKFDGEV